MAASAAHLQERCLAVAERLESVGDIEAASLLRGYGQSLLLADFPCPLCSIEDGLVREWVMKARSVARSKGYLV